MLKPLDGYIYFIQSAKGIKIGFTVQHPEKRLRQLQTGSLEKLTILNYFKDADCRLLERRVHQLFKNYKARHGSEWFCLPPEAVNWILDWRSAEDIK